MVVKRKEINENDKQVENSMQFVPLTVGMVGGVLIVLAATVIYVENRVKESKEKEE